MPRIERGILRDNGIQPLGKRGAGLSQPFPAVGRRHHVRGRRQRRLIDHRARHRNHVVVLCPLHHVARSAVERRPFVSGALSEHIAQTQEDEDRQRQEDDGINNHVAFAFWSAPARGPAVEVERPLRDGRDYIMDGSAACRHETLPSQWRVLSRKAVPEKMGPSRGLLPVYRGRIIARFGHEGKPDRAWKSRIFNNLGGTFWSGAPAISRFPVPAGPLARRFREPRAIVVLVDRGGAMIATRPTKAFPPRTGEF